MVKGLRNTSCTPASRAARVVLWVGSEASITTGALRAARSLRLSSRVNRVASRVGGAWAAKTRSGTIFSSRTAAPARSAASKVAHWRAVRSNDPSKDVDARSSSRINALNCDCAAPIAIPQHLGEHATGG